MFNLNHSCQWSSVERANNGWRSEAFHLYGNLQDCIDYTFRHSILPVILPIRSNEIVMSLDYREHYLQLILCDLGRTGSSHTLAHSRADRVFLIAGHLLQG